MATNSTQPELVVIVGPTASGKSELAMKIARAFNGEIISADSRAIYKGMDVGTAKPSTQDRQTVKHWGLDLITPDQKYSAKQFKDYAVQAIKDIQSRHKLPILVGGTGLYADSVIFEYDFNSSKETNPINPRHRLKSGSSKKLPPSKTLIVGLDPGKELLVQRIEKRADSLLKTGVIVETRDLVSIYGSELESFKAPAYVAALSHLKQGTDLNEVKKIIIQGDLKLAKKQRTWFKRNSSIQWFGRVEEAEQYIAQALNT